MSLTGLPPWLRRGFFASRVVTRTDAGIFLLGVTYNTDLSQDVKQRTHAPRRTHARTHTPQIGKTAGSITLIGKIKLLTAGARHLTSPALGSIHRGDEVADCGWRMPCFRVQDSESSGLVSRMNKMFQRLPLRLIVESVNVCHACDSCSYYTVVNGERVDLIPKRRSSVNKVLARRQNTNTSEIIAVAWPRRRLQYRLCNQGSTGTRDGCYVETTSLTAWVELSNMVVCLCCFLSQQRLLRRTPRVHQRSHPRSSK